MKDPDMERRTVLRGILAAGCAAMVPALAGCDQQQPKVAETSPMPAPMPPASESKPDAATPSAPAAGKLDKAEVQYQDKPKGEQKCADCLHFVAASNSCEKVTGDISPMGWCTLWAGKPPA